ncbi:MAG: hypothetical protein HY549_03470 [Elusimicrobia bacterium]|nr:hypothetical protein [Elusimicrobiota bacterium]
MRILRIAVILSFLGTGSWAQAGGQLEQDKAREDQRFDRASAKDGQASRDGSAASPVLAQPGAAEGSSGQELSPAAPGAGSKEEPVVPSPALITTPPPTPVLVSPKITTQDFPIPGRSWVEARDVKGGLDESNPSAPDKRNFEENLTRSDLFNSLLEEICGEFRIPLKKTFYPVSVLGVRARAERELDRRAQNEIVLVDRVGLSVNTGYSRSLPSLDDKLPISIGFGMSLSGESVVIRPTGDRLKCRAIDDLLKVWNYKTAIDFKASRLMNIKEGEVWQLPIRFTSSISLGVSNGQPGFSAGVSFGASRAGENTVTLRGMPDDMLRVRLRIDEALIYGPGLQVVGRIFAKDTDDYRLDTKNWLGENTGNTVGKYGFGVADDLVIDVLEKWLTWRLGVFAQWQTGSHGLIEFNLNQNDEQHMQALENLLQGRFDESLAMLQDSSLIERLAGAAKTLFNRTVDAIKAFLGREPTKKSMAELDRIFSGRLGAEASFVGINNYKQFSLPFLFKAPILFSWKGSLVDRREDRIRVIGGEGDKYEIYNIGRNSDAGFLDVPFLGYVFKQNESQRVRVMAHREGNGHQHMPVAVYIEQHGFSFGQHQAVESMVGRANGILRYIGVRGEGFNETAQLPPEMIYPPGDKNVPLEQMSYRRGISAFTLLLNDKAITDIGRASDAEVLKAYLHAMTDRREREMMEWVIENGKFSGGSIYYDFSSFRQSFYHSDDLQEGDGRIRQLISYAEGLLKDVHRLRTRVDAQGEPVASHVQAERLSEILAGRGASGLPYEYIMKVLVQLVDPADIWAEFSVSLDARGEKRHKVQRRFLINREKGETEVIRRMSETMGRFARSSKLGD